MYDLFGPTICAVFTGIIGTNQLFPPGRRHTRQQNFLFLVYIAIVLLSPIILSIGLISFGLEDRSHLLFQVPSLLCLLLGGFIEVIVLRRVLCALRPYDILLRGIFITTVASQVLGFVLSWIGHDTGRYIAFSGGCLFRAIVAAITIHMIRRCPDAKGYLRFLRLRLICGYIVCALCVCGIIFIKDRDLFFLAIGFLQGLISSLLCRHGPQKSHSSSFLDIEQARSYQPNITSATNQATGRDSSLPEKADASSTLFTCQATGSEWSLPGKSDLDASSLTFQTKWRESDSDLISITDQAIDIIRTLPGGLPPPTPRLDTDIPPRPLQQQEPARLPPGYTPYRRVSFIFDIAIVSEIWIEATTVKESVVWAEFFGIPGAVDAYNAFGTNNQLQSDLPPASLTESPAYSTSSSSPRVISISDIHVNCYVSYARHQRETPQGSLFTIYLLKEECLTWEFFCKLPGAKAELDRRRR